MRETNIVNALSAVVRAAKTASEIAPIVEHRRYELPLGYSAPRGVGGVARPVEAVLIAQQDRGVMAEVDATVNALNRAAADLEIAIRAMNAALDRWEGSATPTE
ncbi:hypothetical protein HUO13_11880 [Saccharopolyspora erythraea]|uniref:hypothetical protein n=1 Tax=Saccharopolyspora erythraea TaxID=1836 RepID=UPI001BA6D80F|nr:hypothetical protein [Saccharopolyspora erythraea]QUH01414.1 hypothetical protein HUO13_11880 [Saccharopolyspora erythraea]